MFKDLCIHNRISTYRAVHGLSQSELAFRVGISRNALSNIEIGASFPRVNVAFALAQALHCKVTDLFYIQERISLL